MAGIASYTSREFNAKMGSIRKPQTEVFVCDHCGARKRLDKTKRHWCEDCTRGTPVEMRRARDKRVVV